MIYCSVKYCCSNSSIPGVILQSNMKSIKTPNHPAYHWSTLWPLEVWVRGLYNNSWWFCVIHKLSMFIYLSMEKSVDRSNNSVAGSLKFTFYNCLGKKRKVISCIRFLSVRFLKLISFFLNIFEDHCIEWIYLYYYRRIEDAPNDTSKGYQVQGFQVFINNW